MSDADPTSLETTNSPAEWARLIDRITDRTPAGIAQAIGRLISAGQLPVGYKLPTVRAVARQLGVSPTTVSDAWRVLRSHGAIATEGRRGTFVRGARRGAAPGRYWQVPVDPGTFAIDLSTGTPDPALLPSLGPALEQVQLDLPVSSYLEAPVLPDLEEALRAAWPFEPELLTIVDGAHDALDRLVTAIVHLGDTVLVEDPAFPPLLDMFDNAGANVVGLPVDDEGLEVAPLLAALDERPVALFLQPRAHNPTGIATSSARASALAAVLADHPSVIVIEDDHSYLCPSGAVGPLHSLGVHIPHQVVHIRSFSKYYGPDLRLAAIGGSGSPIDSLERRRRLGPSWSSRLLQQLLLSMLRDKAVEAAVTHAADEYARRRKTLVDGLGRHGITVGGKSGLNVWLPVQDEQFALVSLAANGIGASPGSPFLVEPTSTDYLRLSIGAATGAVEDLIDPIARAAQTASPTIRRPA